MNTLEKRCIDISFRHKLTHVSSVLNTVNLIDWIYDTRKPDEPFVLGNSHASLALFVVLEKHGLCDAEEMVNRHGTHAVRDIEHGVYVSGGSLGQAETIAVGMALADPKTKVWLVTSDGACMEGSVWEAMRVAQNRCPNLDVSIVYNGLGAYGPITINMIRSAVGERSIIHYVRQSQYPDWLKGLPGHYLTLSREQYDELMK